MYFPGRPEMETELETYTSSCGLEAQIVQLKDNDWERYMAAFSIHGIPFELTLHGGDMETCREVLIQVLDGFEL